MADGGNGAGSSTTVVARDSDQIGICLDHAGGNGSHSGSRHQFHRHQCLWVNLFQVKDELGQIFDGVNIVVRWRRNKGYPRHRVAQTGDECVHLAARQLATLTGFGPLGDLDLQDLGIDQIGWGDPEAARSDLLDFGHLTSAMAGRIFATLATVGAATQAVHGLGQGLVRFWRQRAQRHGCGIKTADNGTGWFHLLKRYGFLFL